MHVVHSLVPTASDRKLGGAWERGYVMHVFPFFTHNAKKQGCLKAT